MLNSYHSYRKTDTEDNSYIEARNYGKTSQAENIDKQIEEDYEDINKKTEPVTINKHLSENDLIEDYVPSHRLSTSYVDFTRRRMLREISFELSEWIKNKDERATQHVFNIRILLKDYSSYLDRFPDTRLLLGSLELIFDNNEWEKIDERKLVFFKTKIDYLSNNELTYAQMEKFIKEIHTSKIRILKTGNEEKEAR